MKHKNPMEVIGIMSLSMLVTSALSVSSCLPEMMKDFPEYSRSSMEILLSIPAFAMMLVIACTPMLLRILKERVMLTAGLLLIGIAGMVPAFASAYLTLLVSRACLGVGIGLINTKAVSMIGERFTGEFRQKLQGIRCSMETLGQAALTLISGQLLAYSWHHAFYVYGVAFVVLALYLLFVPDTKNGDSGQSASTDQNRPVQLTGSSKNNLTSGQKTIILLHAALGGLTVMTLVQNSLRIASYVIETGIGTAVDGAMVLSISIFAGFTGGLVFGAVLQKFRFLLLPVSMLFTAVGLVIIVLSTNFVTIAVGTSICGFFTTLLMSYMFNGLSDHLPSEALDTANSIVLVGCNLGSCTTPFVLKAIGLINPTLAAGFIAFAIIYFILSILLFFYPRK